MTGTIALERVRPGDLFITEEFRGSAWVHGICDGIADIFVTDDKMLPGHFGTYFGAIMRRSATYGNPYVHDLYHLHELVHVQTFHSSPDVSFTNWMRRMCLSERQASLVSECFAYLHIPGLRANTFAHEIWMDRFLTDDFSQRVLLSGEKDAEAYILKERIRALQTPDVDDYIEHQIWNYGQQNVQWNRIWADFVGYGQYADQPAFRVVERHMARPNWRDDHLAWLESVTTEHDGKRIPFLHQALAFQPFYERTNREYGNHVLMR